MSAVTKVGGINTAEVKSHPQGTPCWAELSTTDEKGALAFYGGLFGWKDDPQPMGPGQFYHMQQVRGLVASAIAQQVPEEKAHKVPTHWRTYLAVTNADDAAKKMAAAGGKVVLSPFDVFDAGRMAMVMDPQGAMFGLWQAKAHIGYRVVDEPGAIAWNELLTTDPVKAGAFYRSVLGVAVEKAPMPGMEYTLMKVAGKDAAGIMKIGPEMGAIPPNWMVYFHTVDVEATVKRAQSLGGKLMMPAMDVPGVGRFAGLMDPQDGAFAVFKPAL